MDPKTADPEPVAGDTSTEQHHGDLRKGAYLRRRADYQMQAHTARVAQAGTLLPDGARDAKRRSR
jgi:hypothetical protein